MQEHSRDLTHEQALAELEDRLATAKGETDLDKSWDNLIDSLTKEE